MERFVQLFGLVQHHNGRRRLASRDLRAALADAGFVRVEAHVPGRATARRSAPAPSP